MAEQPPVISYESGPPRKQSQGGTISLILAGGNLLFMTLVRLISLLADRPGAPVSPEWQRISTIVVICTVTASSLVGLGFATVGLIRGPNRELPAAGTCTNLVMLFLISGAIR